MPKLLELIEQAKDLNPDLKSFSLLSQVPTYSSTKEDSEAKDFLSEFPNLPFFKTMLKDRKVYRDCVSEGKGVVEMNNLKAKAEIQVLVKEILEWL